MAVTDSTYLVWSVKNKQDMQMLRSIILKLFNKIQLYGLLIRNLVN
jgi:hypothetical protein